MMRNRAVRDRESIEDLSNMMNNSSPDRVNNDFNAPAGARVTSGAMRSANALGAGGGGSGGGGGGGAGGGAPAQGGGGGGPATTESGLSFGGAAAGAAATTGKSARKRRNSGKNPFSNMFGKDKGARRNTASVIERDIHKSNIKLFEKISERYDRVERENRLINIVRE